MPDQKKAASYLGDGVYVSPGRYDGEIVLTTDSHLIEEARNRVYLSPDIVQKLQTWLAPAAVWPNNNVARKD